MSIDKSFTDNLIKRLYQIDKDTSIDLQFNRGELEHILKQSRTRTLEDCHDESLGKTEEEFQAYCNAELKKLEGNV